MNVNVFDAAAEIEGRDDLVLRGAVHALVVPTGAAHGAGGVGHAPGRRVAAGGGRRRVRGRRTADPHLLHGRGHARREQRVGRRGRRRVHAGHVDAGVDRGAVAVVAVRVDQALDAGRVAATEVLADAGRAERPAAADAGRAGVGRAGIAVVALAVGGAVRHAGRVRHAVGVEAVGEAVGVVVERVGAGGLGVAVARGAHGAALDVAALHDGSERTALLLVSPQADLRARDERADAVREDGGAGGLLDLDAEPLDRDAGLDLLRGERAEVERADRVRGAHAVAVGQLAERARGHRVVADGAVGRVARVERAGVIVVGVDVDADAEAGDRAGVLQGAGVAVVADQARLRNVGDDTLDVARVERAVVEVVDVRLGLRLAEADDAHVVHGAGVAVVAGEPVHGLGVEVAARDRVARVDRAVVLVVADERLGLAPARDEVARVHRAGVRVGAVRVRLALDELAAVADRGRGERLGVDGALLLVPVGAHGTGVHDRDEVAVAIHVQVGHHGEAADVHLELARGRVVPEVAVLGRVARHEVAGADRAVAVGARDARLERERRPRGHGAVAVVDDAELLVEVDLRRVVALHDRLVREGLDVDAGGVGRAARVAVDHRVLRDRAAVGVALGRHREHVLHADLVGHAGVPPGRVDLELVGGRLLVAQVRVVGLAADDADDAEHEQNRRLAHGLTSRVAPLHDLSLPRPGDNALAKGREIESTSH
ncbi:MAG TPA: hypothetical protein DCS29_01060 [Candidatus Magasanikbacteria bacterium]|nr:hypothetical protein [Candidatus Magasanikbacteria bacterium]